MIHAGQVARVGREGSLAVGEHTRAEVIKRFTRVMPGRQANVDAYAELVLSMNPVVYYRMDDWAKGKDKDTYVLVDSAPGHHHGTLHYAEQFGGDPWGAGRFGKSLWLRGASAGDYAIVRDYPQTEDNQISVSAWVRPLETSCWTPFVANWWGPPDYSGSRGQFFLTVYPNYDLAVQIHDRNAQQ